MRFTGEIRPRGFDEVLCSNDDKVPEAELRGVQTPFCHREQSEAISDFDYMTSVSIRLDKKNQRIRNMKLIFY